MQETESVKSPIGEPDESSGHGYFKAWRSLKRWNWRRAIRWPSRWLGSFQCGRTGAAASTGTANADSQLLAEARAALESGDSLELSGEQLMVLEQRRKHLPAKISAAEKTGLEIELQIQKLSTDNEISVPALVSEIIRQTKNAAGRIVDESRFSLVRFLPVPPSQ